MRLHGDASAAHYSAIATSGVVAGSLALAASQYVIARRGMGAVDQGDGLQSIGTAFGYATVDIAVTLAPLLISARALGVKHWVVSGLAVTLGDLGLLLLLWRFLNGESQRSWPGAFVFAVALVMPTLIVWVAATRWSGSSR